MGLAASSAFRSISGRSNHQTSVSSVALKPFGIIHSPRDIGRQLKLVVVNVYVFDFNAIN